MKRPVSAIQYPGRPLAPALALVAPVLLLVPLAIGAATVHAVEDGPAPPKSPVLATAAPRTITLTGFTRARAEAPLVAETPGRVLELFGDIGDALDDGRFARLDDTFLRLDLDEIAVQQDRLRAQIEFDQREVKRYQELARQSNASASQLDTLEQALRNNGHELRVLEVKARALTERLARTTVRGQTGWRITARSVEPGQWVHEGETIGRAADFSALIVPFALTPEQFEALQAQTEPLALRIPTQGVRVPASIYRANPGFDPETRKIAVDLRIDAPLDAARGGLRAELSLQLPERTGAVSLPASALEHSYDEYWITREDGERLRVLLLGEDRDDPTRVRVTAPGLSPGDPVRLPGGN